MSPFISRLQSIKSTGSGKQVVSDEEKDQQGKKGVKLTAAIFFDGTLNNRTNTRLRLSREEELTLVERRARGAKAEAEATAKGATARLHTAIGAAQRTEAEPEAVAAEQALTAATREHEAAAKALEDYKKGVTGKSGANFYSNVSILGEMVLLQNKTKGVVHYIEGIGTTDGGSDDMHGYAFGAGFSGIVAKVNKGIREMAIKLKGKYKPRIEYIEELRIDVFGFSRGAAAARHFMARKSLYQGGASTICQALGLRDPAVVKFRFVGLFDTVSSYNPGLLELHHEFEGLWRTLNEIANIVSLATNLPRSLRDLVQERDVDPEFANDVEELGLRLTEPAEKIVQLAAGDEHRRNFPLTSICSAFKVGKGCELLLPGAHSDVGGGYGEVEEESRPMRLVERRRLEQEGWYEPDDDTYGAPLDGYNPTITSARTGLTNVYQFVPLALMLELAHLNGMDFQSFAEDKFKAYVVPPALRDIYASLREQAVTYHNNGASKRQPLKLQGEQLHWLRRRYLHISHTGSRYMPMGPRRVDSLPERYHITG